MSDNNEGDFPDAEATSGSTRAQSAELQRSHVALLRELERLSLQRRAQPLRPEAKDVHHAIALGSVLARLSLRASDSWKLDGLLSGSVADFVALLTRAGNDVPGKNAGAALVRALDLDGLPLHAKGQAAAWRRKYRQYLIERDDWLATGGAHRIEGAWRAKRPTPAQVELVRLTCALLETDLPALVSRGGVHDWLEATGANLRYPRTDA